MTSSAALAITRHPSSRMTLLVLLVVGAALLGTELTQGWYPHDEGALGQSAERVLGGEIPHRDFDEIYTGLLTYLHAGTFAALGTGSIPMRIPLLVASLLWLAAMYRILRRFAPPLGAALAALTAFTWGVPNYPAALPSWYILFAATFGALALLRWHETGGQRSWLVIAGAMGGIAFLFKLSGIFFFLGGGLALLAADDAPAPAEGNPAPSASPGVLQWGVAAAVTFTAMTLGWIVGRAGDRELLRFGLPTATVSVAIAAHTLRHRFTPARSWGSLAGRLLPFAVGGIIPIALFFAFYAAVGGLPEMLDGVFVTPFRRISFAAVRPPSTAALAFAAPFALFLWLRPTQGVARILMPAAAAVGAIVIITLSSSSFRFYALGWLSAWGLLFFVAIEGARQLLRRCTTAPAAPHAQSVVTLACIAVAMALVEYPFAAPIYTLYALPLAIAAAAAAVRVSGRSPAPMQLTLLLFLLLFGYLRIVPGTVGSLGVGFIRSREIAPLELPRSGLRVDLKDATLYEELIPFVRERAAGRAIWAGPDAPEVYFLTGLPNHTRTLFEFLDASTTAHAFVDRLDSLRVAVVVVKLWPHFSPRVSPETIQTLRGRYPHERMLPGFLVLWR